MKTIVSILLALWANVAVAQTSPCYWSGQLTKCYPTTGLYLDNQRSLRLGDTSTNYVQWNAPASVSTYSLTLPNAPAASNTSAMISDTSGTLTWLVVQPAGNYITALTGNVTATGPGSAVATIANFATNRYVDFILGDDTTGTGTPVQPWKSLQKACNSITPSINLPYAIHISGGNNDPDAAPVTCPPNIAIVSDYDLQLKQNLTITGGTLPLNDTVWFQNIILLGTFNWVRNDATEISVYTVNSVFTQPFDFEQQGSGYALSFLNMFGGYVNGLTLRVGQANLEAVGTISGTINYMDSGAAYFIVTAADIFAADIQLHGGMFAQFSGNIADSGYTLTGTATGTGTPAIMSDSGSLPPTIAGAYTLSLTSPGQYVSYTPTTSANWTSAPTTVLGALDTLASSGAVKAQSANTVLSGPTSGGATVPAFRALVSADIPNLPASKITSGQLAVAQGGTGLASGTSGGVLYYSATGTLASSALLSSNGVVLGGGAGGAPATITDATATHLLHGGSPPSFTAMTSADIPTTISTARTWNDIQTWKAAGGTVAAGSYDASANWTLGLNGAGNTHSFFASIINQGGLAATSYNILAGATGNAALQFGVTGNAVDAGIVEPYQSNALLTGDAKGDLDITTNGHAVNFSASGLGAGGTIGGSMSSGAVWQLGIRTGSFPGHKIRGTDNGGSAASGDVGQVTSAVASSSSSTQVSLPTGTYANIASISLTAGHYLLFGNVDLAIGSLTGPTICRMALSAFSAGTTTDAVVGDNFVAFPPPSASTDASGSIVAWEVNPTTTTTYYLKARIDSSGGTAGTGNGRITAHRIY